MLRVELGNTALSLFNLNNHYIFTPVGPPHKAVWKGSPCVFSQRICHRLRILTGCFVSGGAKGAPTILSDLDWKGRAAQLELSPKSVTTVELFFDLMLLLPFKANPIVRPFLISFVCPNSCLPILIPLLGYHCE